MRRIEPAAVRYGSAASDEAAEYLRLLARVVDGEPLRETLAGVCLEVERAYPGTHCLLSLVDRTAGVLRFGAGPSVPEEFAVVVDGLIVGRDFSVMSEAALRGQVIVVQDTRTHPLARHNLKLLELHGIRSAVLQPLRERDGVTLGVMAVYRSTEHTPSKSELDTIQAICNIATLALDRDRMHATSLTAGNVDDATGLSNRMHFLEAVNDHLRQSDDQIAVLAVEIDRFRQIRDSLDKLVGDRMFSEIGFRLIEAIGDDGLCGRYGDDQFAVMIPAPDALYVNAIIDRLASEFETPVVSDGGEFFVTASVGVAYGHTGTDAYGLMAEAKTAMHAARADGLGRRRVYDEELHARALFRLRKEGDLRNAISRGELFLHYQPCLDLRTRRWTRLEALVRWEHPERGMIPPDHFIPLAEETGLIIPLGAKVLEMAIAQARIWWQRFPEVRIAVNISVMQLANPTFADEVLAMLTAADLPPEALIIEVTESALMQEPEITAQSLRRLHDAGMPAVLDDFGTGHSSLARLRELPVRTLKVDRRLTADIRTDAAARTVVSAIAAIAEAHDLMAVAEGLEDAESLALVSELGYSYGQGYHLARPAPVEMIDALLAAPVPEHLVNIGR